jgi:phenylacetate-CoA ligase
MSFVRNVLIPLYDFATRNHTRKYMRELEKSQWFTQGKIKELQEKKLRRLIKHAYETVPYYHRIFRKIKLKFNDIKGPDDLARLPILSREKVREEFDALISRGYPRTKMVYGCTGGSTGEPTRFYTTRENRCWSNAARYLAWQWTGFEIGDKFAQVFGLHLDRPMFESARGKLEGVIKRRISLDAYKMSEKTLEEFTHQISRFKPKVVYGTAAGVAILAKYIEEKKIKGIQMESVIIDSMKLFEHEIETIESVFGCKVWWNYHNRENGTFASECSEHSGYHLFAQNFVFEFVKEGEQVAPGETGAILVTDLHNYAMPFIRYEVGDMGVPSHEICDCGRGLPLMSKLFGRTAEILVSATGEFITAPFYGHLQSFFDPHSPKIKQYQVIQETPGKILVKIIPDEGYSPEDTETIRRIMFSIMGNLEIEIELVNSIATSGSGKRRVRIRKFPIEFTKTG